MKKLALRFTRNYKSDARYVRTGTAVALIAIGVSFASRALLFAQLPDLSGTYAGDDGGIYYVQQSGNTLWWAGMSMDGVSGLRSDNQWHRGLGFTSVFRGTINPANNTVTGDWADVTRGALLQNGTLTAQIGSSPYDGSIQLTVQYGAGSTTILTQGGPLDDTKVAGVTKDIFARFDAVPKNVSGETLLNPNLKPYRDQTVFYARLVNSHLDYLNDNSVESEVPHVNYGPDFSPTIPSFRNFAAHYRAYIDFLENASDGDGDFDVRLKVDLNKLEPDFYDVGWENHLSAPDILRWKLNSSTVRQKLNFSSTEGYSGAETIMFGRPSGPLPDGGSALLPGWADLGSNSVLINGRPINGGSAGTNCGGWTQPCPYLAGETPDELDANYLVVPLGIRLKNLLLSAYGSGQIHYGSGCSKPDGCVDDGAGTYVRVTGALILDCGHGLTHDCFDDPSDQGDVSGHTNQELHPVYSIDIINKPFRPEDTGVSARPNLTGAWGGDDGSTYYVRQIGNTLWFLGLLRDREPSQQATSYDLIGTPQVAAAGLLVGSPICQSGDRCWMFGTVFKGTISQNSDGSSTVTGDWAGVPQSTSPGSIGSSVSFTVDSYHKVMTPNSLQGLFPTKLEKLYEPEDSTPPQSTLTIGTPQYPTGASQPFVTSATSFGVAATDDSSGVQNISYRFFPSGSNPAAYTSAAGSSTTFYLSGADGLYEVDTYATDAAGNDEAAHSQLVYLDNTAPAIVIAQPTATQYSHSTMLTLNYAVSDGAGSGVQSFIPTIDGTTALTDGHTLQSGPPPINFLTEMALGPHVFSISAVDNLGNAGTSTVNFSIVVTPDSIKGDVTQFAGMGAIKNKGLSNSLLAKLNAAAKARARGNCKTAANNYRSFINELQAQSGTGISAQAASVMIGDAQYLIAHCP